MRPGSKGETMTRALWTLGLTASQLLGAAASTVRGQDGGPTLPSACNNVVPLRAANLARTRFAIAATALAAGNEAFHALEGDRQVPSHGAAGVHSNSGSFTSGAGQVC